jgi:hypothetical protein
VAAAARAFDFALDGRIEHQAALVGRDRSRQAEPQHAGKTSHSRRYFFPIVHAIQSTSAVQTSFCALRYKAD